MNARRLRSAGTGLVLVVTILLAVSSAAPAKRRKVNVRYVEDTEEIGCR